MKAALYLIIVAAYAAGGVLDFTDRDFKSAAVALLFAAANAVIFLWR